MTVVEMLGGLGHNEPMAANKRQEAILQGFGEVFKRELNAEYFILFGSRAKGEASEGADYDIALKGKRPDIAKEEKMDEACEVVLGLHELDLVYLDQVSREFKEHILKTGKRINV